MVVWLRNSLIVLVFMTETSEALGKQTEELTVKKFGDQEVVLGPGFTESNPETVERVQRYKFEKYFPDVNFDDVKNYINDFFQKPKKFIKRQVDEYKFQRQEPEFIETIPEPKMIPTPEFAEGKQKEEPVREEIETPIVPKEKPAPPPLDTQIYNYLINEKRLSQNKALGIMANIKGESDFSPGADEAGDGSEGIGLFQYTFTTRKNKFLDAVPDYKNNWRGQIDFFLTEPEARRYLDMEFKSANDAATYLLNNNLRPRESVRDARKEEHKTYIEKFLDGLQ